MFRSGTKSTVTWLVLGSLMAGCGDPSGPAPDQVAQNTRNSDDSRVSASPRSQPREVKLSDLPAGNNPRQSTTSVTKSTDFPPIGQSSGPHKDSPPAERRRPLAHLLDQPADSAPRWIADLPRLQVDDARAAAAGIRKLSSRRLTLYTDLPVDEEIERLPQVFDLAFGQWCEYFHIDKAKHADWNMTGFLMKDGARFRRAGLLPGGLPPFKHGFARNHELWLYEQPSAYYRRHLLLHEGTHGFMNTILGACGPPWYMEGLAELLSTHRWHDGRLRLNYMPTSREEVPYWGRVKIIKDALAENRAKHLINVLEYSASAHQETEPYAWCWAVATLLDKHPRYRDRFRLLYKDVLKPDFTDRFFRLMKDDWQQLSEEWQVMVAGLEYGYDVGRSAVDFTPGKALPTSGGLVTVAADRGWQNSGLRLEGGVAYRLTASGRYVVAQKPQPWVCEPGGVSIRYYRGRPLGLLIAALRPDDPADDGFSALQRSAVVGLETTLTPNETGTLYLKINDSAAELDDNTGELKVEIHQAPPIDHE